MRTILKVANQDKVSEGCFGHEKGTGHAADLFDTVVLKSARPLSETTVNKGLRILGRLLKAYQDTYQSHGLRTMLTRGKAEKSAGVSLAG